MDEVGGLRVSVDETALVSTGLTGLAWNRNVRAGAYAIAGALLFFGVLHELFPAPLGIVIQGMIIGSLTALLSIGIALVYRANRVVNFAQADMGAVPATLAVTLMAWRGWSYWLAVPVGLVTAVVLGAAVERLVIRRFSRAPRLILMVVTIGLAQVFVAMAFTVPVLLRPDGVGGFFPPQRFQPPFEWSFTLSPVVFHANELLALMLAAGCALGLFVLLRRTDIGIAIRGSAESLDRAALLGINVGRTQNVVWMVASLLAAITMILRAGILGLPFGSAFGPAILMRALTAAVIARMERFSVMVVAAMALGIIEASILWDRGTVTLLDPILFVIVLGALLFQRRRRESRVEDQAVSSWQQTALVRPIPPELARFPEVRWALRAPIVVLGAGLLLLPAVLDIAQTNLAAAALIYAIVAVSLVILTGWAGEISLGQIAFVGIGAAAAAGLNFHLHWDLLLSTLAAGALGAAAALLIGLPALRIRGLFLAVSTLAFALATSSYLLNPEYFSYLPDPLSETVYRFPLLGRLSIASEEAFYYVCLAALVVAVSVARQLQRTRTYRVLVAGRENPRGAQAFGVSVTRTKLLAFAVSGFFASFAGGLLVVHQGAVGEKIFAPAESIRALTMVVVGGLGSIPGALLGTAFVKSTEWFDGVVPESYRFFFTFAGSGFGLLVILMVLPGGLGSLIYRSRDAVLRSLARRKGVLVPSLIADTADARHGAPTRRRGPWASRAGHPPAVLMRLARVLGLADRSPERRRRAVLRVAVGLLAVSVSAIAVGVVTGSALPVVAAVCIGVFGLAILFVLARDPSPVLDELDRLAETSGNTAAVSGAGRSLLRVEGVNVSYGSVQVLFDVDLEVREGAVVALLGTNGAGKSTVLRAISGLTAPGAGRVFFDGEDITGMRTDLLSAKGIAQMPGGRGVFPSLSVAENLRLAGWLHRAHPEQVRAATERGLDMFPVLRTLIDTPAANLSGGQQQMLSLAMVLITKPRLLMIDELSLGLAPAIVEQLLHAVRALRDEGVTVIVVEQSVNVALTIAETAYFMEKGEVRFHGPTAELLDRPDILRAVFLKGSQAATDATSAEPVLAQPRSAASAGNRVVLRTDGLTKSFAGIRAMNDLSISLREGEILGIIGPNGAGKTTLFDLLCGFLIPDAGTVHLLDEDITALSPEARSLRGLARSFQDARLFGALTVRQAIAVALDRQLHTTDPVAAALGLHDVVQAEEHVTEEVERLIALMRLEAYDNKFVGELSTGTRRIVDLACQVALQPAVVLFDEPSSGIAQRETEELGRVLLDLRNELDASFIVIEHDMPMLRSIADRMIALELGRFVTEGPPDDVLHHPDVVASYLGSDPEVIERSRAVTAS
jgi:ABC-type branched-subunit amino acid transport system ATPase component/ABC-type branched-subunit amino acid transport system permease subunit